MLTGKLTLTPIDALTELTWKAQELAEKAGGARVAIGLAGGPGTGKSTLAAELVAALNVSAPGSAALVPMDGFHMKHAKLEAMGQTDFKGAPHTFEGAEFVTFLGRLKSATEAVSGPGYSRKIEDTVDDAFTVAPEVKVLVVEGNYLLLGDAPWAGVKPLLDFSAFITVPRELVRARLMKRHGEEGLFTEERNRAHIERNDLPNYDRVMLSQDRADVVITLDVER
ncbi:MAG TPA: nucleoside/nucleotide kinase family protein [Devosia sp.]|nr:nucleoside/nucleotide kinase family protein [Devosia sp.]